MYFPSFLTFVNTRSIYNPGTPNNELVYLIFPDLPSCLLSALNAVLYCKHGLNRDGLSSFHLQNEDFSDSPYRSFISHVNMFASSTILVKRRLSTNAVTTLFQADQNKSGLAVSDQQSRGRTIQE